MLERLLYHKHMRAFTRLLLWILIAALPLQGGAVAFMSFGSGTAPSYSVEHHNEDAAAAAREEHCAQSGADHLSAPHGKCSHCASCCVGAAAPPAVPSVLMPTTFSTFAGSTVEPAMTAYIPATLERPPRRLS
jgi:hypothetical protein